MAFVPKNDRYEKHPYRRCGNSGLKLPAVSLGLWHNFGAKDDFSAARKTVLAAFDAGITHFDLANNYGPPAGSAEITFGKIMKRDLRPWRDEIVVSTKAGYWMWPGPYGEWGSRKYALASLDQSLKRMGLEYVDIFYSHRPDPETPVEETIGALDSAVRSGKALYAGISNYNPEQTLKALAVFRALGTPCLIHQFSYSMFNRWSENGLLELLEKEKIGAIVFSPLAQGLLSGKYLDGIPADSRAARGGFLKPEHVTPEKLDKVRRVKTIADRRGQTISQLALAWLLQRPVITSVLVGARNPDQLLENASAAKNTSFTAGELEEIGAILA
jgi:L-glyceraldehyde 3-phosphate reductase